MRFRPLTRIVREIRLGYVADISSRPLTGIVLYVRRLGSQFREVIVPLRGWCYAQVCYHSPFRVFAPLRGLYTAEKYHELAKKVFVPLRG